MTVGTFLEHATKQLTSAGINSVRLDCLVLLEDALHRDRAHILAHTEAKITPETEVELNKKIAQRAKNMPLAYIRGFAPFYGRKFAVNPHVLVPRPESEAMITLLTTLPLSARPAIADIGTGSGCLGITSALELPGAVVHLYDVDPLALETAKQNSEAHGVKPNIIRSDLLERYTGPYDAILANLPYVPKDFAVNEAAKHEPSLALYGGQDGLDVYRCFWQQIAMLGQKPLYILTESLTTQHAVLADMAGDAGYHLLISDGLIQLFELTG